MSFKCGKVGRDVDLSRNVYSFGAASFREGRAQGIEARGAAGRVVRVVVPIDSVL